MILNRTTPPTSPHYGWVSGASTESYRFGTSLFGRGGGDRDLARLGLIAHAWGAAFKFLGFVV